MFLAIWIDEEEARLFSISDEKMERTHLYASSSLSGPGVVTLPLASEGMYREIALKISLLDKVYLMGPGDSRMHFLDFIHKNFPGHVGCIVANEMVDSPTDAQIANSAMKFLGLTLARKKSRRLF